MAVALDQIVPWGRSRDEYERMFAMSREDLAGGVLDCGGGPASFAAEMSRDGLKAVSIDPIYNYSGPEIHARFEATVKPMIDQVRATASDYVWTYHRSPDDLCANRRAAIEKFLVDYEDGLRARRYLAGELPSLPFEAKTFGLAVCSHLLFLYSELLSESFHIDSVLELCRVAREVRIFPLLTLACKPSPHVAAVRSALGAQGWKSEVVRVDYELQRGGNEMLRIMK